MRNFRIFPRFTPLTIAYAAMLVAIGVVLAIYSIPVDFLNALSGGYQKKIGFSTIPIMLGGMLFGPVVGGVVGALTDVIQFMIQARGFYNPFTTVIMALFGIIAGLFYIMDKSDQKKAGRAYLKALLTTYTVQLLCSAVLNTFSLMFYTYPQLLGDFFTKGVLPQEGVIFILVRLGVSLVVSPVYALVLHTLYRYRRVYISPRMEQQVAKSQRN